MSATRATAADAARAEAMPRRVREQARDVVVLMAFSAGLSVTAALLLLIAPRLGR